jgi:2,4-dienoyl-CoA reductase (NADPH2)
MKEIIMHTMRNTYIFAPIKLGYSAGDGKVSERHKAFYRKRSRHIGAVTLEPLYMDSRLREIPAQLGIDSDDKMDGLRELVNTIHTEGAGVIAHLNHPGRMANPNIPGNIFLSSTAAACENGGIQPAAMTIEDIQSAVSLFTESAIRAEKIGFDYIELQFGHGYLAAQFLSPQVNNRTDAYGGSFSRRTAFSLEILDAVRNSVKIPIIVRISGDEMTPEGITLLEMVKFSSLLKKHGAAAIHVSAGSICTTPPWFFQHMFIPKGKTWTMAETIRQEVQIPVIAVGQINTFDDLDKLHASENIDYIAVGRALVADPDFIGKYENQVSGFPCPCLACAEGCLGGVKAGKGLQCLVNPQVGRENIPLTMARTPSKYAVIGGGLAGMQAALTLVERGHSPTIFEQNEPGGQFRLAPLTPHKASMARLIPYFKAELERKQVTIIRKTADAEDVEGFDGVITATGSVPAVPEIPGLNAYRWADILQDNELPEHKRILIIGGGLIGVDIATALIPRDNTVIIVKRTTDFGEDMEMIAKTLSLKMMKEHGTIFSDHTHIKHIDGRTVHAERNGTSVLFENIDLIVVSAGMKSLSTLEVELKGKVPVYPIGDAKQIGNAQDAIRSAYDAAAVL